jgi:hypothetical protein
MSPEAYQLVERAPRLSRSPTSIMYRSPGGSPSRPSLGGHGARTSLLATDPASWDGVGPVVASGLGRRDTSYDRTYPVPARRVSGKQTRPRSMSPEAYQLVERGRS